VERSLQTISSRRYLSSLFCLFCSLFSIHPSLFFFFSPPVSSLFLSPFFLSPQFPKLYNVVVEVLSETCRIQAVEVAKRVEEMFLQDFSGANASSDKALIECINHVRISRFETALRGVLAAVKQEEDGPRGASAAATPTAFSSSSSSSSSSKEVLKKQVLHEMGPLYMSFHGIQSHRTLLVYVNFPSAL
jgi:hypothetical protein